MHHFLYQPANATTSLKSEKPAQFCFPARASGAVFQLLRPGDEKRFHGLDQLCGLRNRFFRSFAKPGRIHGVPTKLLYFSCEDGTLAAESGARAIDNTLSRFNFRAFRFPLRGTRNWDHARNRARIPAKRFVQIPCHHP